MSDDLLHALIGHGRLVQRVGHNTGGVDTLHFLLELLHGQSIEGRLAAHQPAGAMRCGAIPILVALAAADQATVTHVDGDQQLLAGLGGDRALTQDHGVRINIVVDGGEGLHRREAHASHDNIHHGLAVEHGELLCQLHIVDIVLEQLTLHIGQIFGDIQLVLLLERLDGLLDLLEPALGLQLVNGGLNLILGAAPKGTPTLILVVLSHLGAQMTAARVDHQEQPAILCAIHLNEVVAATQRADAAHGPVEIDLICAAEVSQIDLSVQCMRNVSNLTAIGDLPAD